MLRVKLALQKVVERNDSMHMRQISDLNEATAVAVLGKALHGSLVDLLVTFILLCYLKHFFFTVGWPPALWPGGPGGERGSRGQD